MCVCVGGAIGGSLGRLYKLIILRLSICSCEIGVMSGKSIELT